MDEGGGGSGRDGLGGHSGRCGRSSLYIWEVYVFAVIVHALIAFLSPPQITVYNDEITYRVMSRDLIQDGRIHRELPYRMSVPPLYPLALGVTNLVQDPDLRHRLSLIFNMALYFLALFPVYRIALRFLEPRHALLAAGLMVLSPQTIYSSWCMSENLYFPLFAVFLMLLLESGDGAHAHMPRWRIAALGLALAGCMLTRLSGLQAAAMLPLLLVFRMWDRNDAGGNGEQPPPDREAIRNELLARHLIPLGLAAVIVIIAWRVLGYIGPEGKGIFYQPESAHPLNPRVYAWDLGYWFSMNLTEYVVASGMVIFPLACYGLMAEGRAMRDMRRVFAITLVILLAGVALVSADLERLSSGFWHPITRYMFYINPLLFPLAVLGWRRLQAKGEPSHRALGSRGPLFPASRIPFRAWIYLAVGLAWFMFVHGYAHESLKMVRAWFADAPDLEFYRHVARRVPYPWGQIAANAMLAGGAVVVLGICRRFPRIGLAVAAVILINLKIQTYEYQDQLLRRHEAIYGPVRDFAWMAQRAEVERLPIIVINYDDMARPLGNLFYWTTFPDVYLTDGFAWVSEGFYVTNEERAEPLVYRKGEWRVYRFLKR